MNREEMLSYILDSVPYRVVFVDMDHVIRYMNRQAKYHYHVVRGYDNLIGKSIFECHSEKSGEMLLQAVEKLKITAMRSTLVSAWRTSESISIRSAMKTA